MSDLSDETTNRCGICGEPMPPGEEMFKYHGYSGPCPKPPLKAEQVEQSADWWMKMADREGDHAVGAVGGALPDAAKPRQVEVVCDPCGGTGVNWAREDCVECGGYATQHCTAAPDSLTARMLDLAEAADRMERAKRTKLDRSAAAKASARDEFRLLPRDWPVQMKRMQDDIDNATAAYESALASARNHPDYRRPE